jgi:uncharacterized membrane protein
MLWGGNKKITTLIPFLVLGMMVVIGIAFIIYGVIGAIRASQGKPFRYAIIGKRVERFMQAGQNTATNSGTL